jgi:hypothetical protein
MTAFARLLNEFISLFVDDGSLAATILIWIALCGLFMPSSLRGPFEGAILFGGLALILLENAARGARRLAKTNQLH